jgi:septum formation protein
VSSFPPVTLASASPRRRELLNLIGIPHTVCPADIDETPFPNELPSAHAERLARTKAEAVVATLGSHAGLVVAADTIVVIDEKILGKPVNTDDAARMLKQLSGRTHTVVTGVACAYKGQTVATTEEVRVTFRSLSDTEIADYIATGEPMDKAGAYGIQGFGATIVQRIEGDYFAVMGLSLVRMIELWKQLGVSYRFGRENVGV